MRNKKHKRKKNHLILVTSDTVDTQIRQFRISPAVLQIIILVLCVAVGVLIGFLNYERQQVTVLGSLVKSVQAERDRAEEEKLAVETQKQNLEYEILEKDEQIQILSQTVNQKMLKEEELTARLEGQSLPTEFPLNGSSTMEEINSEEPICIFEAPAGTLVVAAAKGMVSAVNADAEYGFNVWIDHGNGYVTVYRNAGEPVVEAGNSVVQGSTIFIIGEENTKLGYQMLHDGSYIKPTDMLAISG